ncbi:MAG TPA: FHA domain-containing protein, partial [Thermoanaerobaculia bacterium]|nr:FHA domain-containing protein [Thermoanaerobaculia bacterium]
MNGWQIFVEVPGHAPVELKPGESIIGRSRTSQVHIPESTVSRQHARLVVGGLGEVGVEDLGSSNGTFVNGEKVEGRRKLQDGDRILIGDAELRVRIVAPVAAAEATVRMVLPPLGPPP